MSDFGQLFGNVMDSTIRANYREKPYAMKKTKAKHEDELLETRDKLRIARAKLSYIIRQLTAERNAARAKAEQVEAMLSALADQTVRSSPFAVKTNYMWRDQ